MKHHISRVVDEVMGSEAMNMLERTLEEKTNWGEPHSDLRKLKVAGLMAELKQHLDAIEVDKDRLPFITADAEMLDEYEALLEAFGEASA